MPASAFLRFGQPPELDEGGETDDAGLRRPSARWQPVAPGGASCVARLQCVYDGGTGEHRPQPRPGRQGDLPADGVVDLTARGQQGEDGDAAV